MSGHPRDGGPLPAEGARAHEPVADAPGTSRAVSGEALPGSEAGLFVRGPVDWDWLKECGRLPGRALHVAVVLQLEAGMRKSLTVELRAKRLLEIGVDADATRRALQQMESAGLIEVERRPGRLRVVTMKCRDLLSKPGLPRALRDQYRPP